jgi:hypothetical protein
LIIWSLRVVVLEVEALAVVVVPEDLELALD